MVKRWNRPRTVSVLGAAFRAGWGDRLTLPVMLTWSKWGAVDRAGRGEVGEGPRSASPLQLTSIAFPISAWSGTTSAPQSQQASDDRDEDLTHFANQTASHHGPATAGVCLRIHSASRRSYRVQRVVSTTRARSHHPGSRPARHLT